MSFEQVFMYGGAPVLCGIKDANLFSMNSNMYEKEIDKINLLCTETKKSNIYIVPIHKAGRVLFFVFNKNKIVQNCYSYNSINYLKSKGYTYHFGFDGIILELINRLANSTEFPHEIGLFLGYPLQDVIMFEEKAGKDFIFSGHWKVYSDVQNSINKMKNFRDCRDFCLNLVSEGYSVLSAIDKYKYRIANNKSDKSL